MGNKKTPRHVLFSFNSILPSLGNDPVETTGKQRTLHKHISHDGHKIGKFLLTRRHFLDCEVQVLHSWLYLLIPFSFPIARTGLDIRL